MVGEVVQRDARPRAPERDKTAGSVCGYLRHLKVPEEVAEGTARR